MNAKFLFTVCLIVSIFLAGCSPAATAVPIATAPRNTTPPLDEPRVELRVEPTQAVAPTQASKPPAPGTGENYFQDAGVNPQENTLRDHLSTFAIDVDTASYAVARKYVEKGMLPPPEAVRAEEFINAFDQGYATPPDATFAIYADGAPNPFNREMYLLRFGVQGYRLPDELRKPAVLTFVIDSSGSMNMDKRLGLVKRSLQLLVNQLDARDSVAIVAYNSVARIVLEPTSGGEHAEIIRALSYVRPEGTTNVEAGLREGYRWALGAFRQDAINRVILCSDGVANTGDTDPEVILNYVHGYGAEGINLTSIGVGMGNFNDVLLEQLADRGNGNYYYVDTPEEARKVFVEHLTSTLQVIAYDAKIQVDFNPDVVDHYRLIGYENRTIADQDFRNDSTDAGEIGAGHTVTALYEVTLAPQAEGRIATFQLRWQDADSRQVKEINGNFNTWDLLQSFNETDPHYQLTVAVAQYAEVLRASPYVSASLDDVSRLAQRIAQLLPGDPQAQEFAELTRLAARIPLNDFYP